MIQVDFAGNYVCHYRKEVAAAYFFKTQVTVPPCVVLVLLHKTLVLLSKVLSHKATTIFAFLKRLMSWLRDTLPRITQVHYLSDSPSSQYQNGMMFRTILQHEGLFHVRATWNYFESGHGKGPCDGVGGSVKLSTDLAFKKGLITKTASNFYNWAITQEHSVVTYRLLSQEEVTQATEQLETMGKIPTPGTMKIHSVIPVGDQLFTRKASCYFPCCWSGNTFHHQCDGWVSHDPAAKRGKVALGDRGAHQYIEIDIYDNRLLNTF